VNCLGYGAATLGFLGYVDQALARVEAAYALVQELSHPYSAAWTQIFTIRVHIPTVYPSLDSANIGHINSFRSVPSGSEAMAGRRK
jgi:hypothetical protein